MRHLALLLLVSAAWAEEPKAIPGLKLTPEGARFRMEYAPDPDQPTIKGFLAYPKGAGPFPAVIVNHGSNGDAGKAMDRFAGPFLDAGYVVMACDLAHAGGSKDRNPAESRRRLLACLSMLEQDAKVDGKRLAMYGNSYGAFVTLAVATLSDKVRVAAMTGGGWPRREEDACDVTKMAGSMLILHGADDTTVPVASAKTLKEKLDAAGRASEIVIYEGVGHDLPEVKKAEVFAKIVEYFGKALGDKAADAGPVEVKPDAPKPAAAPGKIQWYATWAQARADAARLNRPILLVSAAPQCHGISGIW